MSGTGVPGSAAAFHEVAGSRRSIREFLPDAPPREVLDRCLDSALMAPSASNLQPWEFVVVRSPEARAEADRVCLDQKLLRSAPLLVAVITHRGTWKRNSRFILDTLRERGILRRSQERYWGRLIPWMYRQDPLGLFGAFKHAASRILSLFRPVPSFCSKSDLRAMTHKSAALAAATFMLALRAEGYDSCPLEGFDPWRARKVLGLGAGAEVCMFLAVGRRTAQAVWWDRILLPRTWTVKEL